MKKVIVITGSSSGFGYETAKILADAGHIVYATMRNISTTNKPAKERLLKIAEETNVNLHVVEIDVTSQTSVKNGINTIISEQGRIDVVVNNAGIISYGVNESFQLDQVRNMFDVNFFGVFLLNNEVLPYMRKQHSGLLIHISSVLGRLVVPSIGIYSASKFAIEALAETYRYDLAGTGVDSVIVNPGGYPTNLNDNPDEPANGVIIDTYGDMGKLGSQLLSNMRNGLDGRDITDIGQIVLKLVENDGHRPLRTGVGVEAQIMTPLNDYASEIQANLLNAFGMVDILPLSK